MKSDLVEQIVCPECHTNFSLKIKKKQKDETIEGILTCSKKHRFSVIRGIPRLVSDKQKDFVKTEDAFSSKWRHFNKTYHNKKWIEDQKRWFLERFGWKSISKLNGFLKTRSKILDAGTGVGNSAKLFSSNSNAQVFGIDASESIEFAYKKYGKIRNIHFLQADIRKLPFKKNFLILFVLIKYYTIQKILNLHSKCSQNY